MLHFIRERAQGWIATIIVALLIIPFALWGINQYFGGGGQAVVAKVNGTEISQRDFKQDYYQQRARMQQMLGKQYDARLFDPQIKKRVINHLVDQELLLQNADKVGLRVSDETVAATIRSIKAFSENGVFSTQRYEQVLQTQGESPTGFEHRVKQMTLASQLPDGLASTVLVTDAEVDNVIRLQQQKRDFRYFMLTVSKYKDASVANEASIKSYYEKHRDQYKSPEQVSVQYVELSAARIQSELAKNNPPTDQQLREFYQANASKYVVPEERKASHILIQVPKGADKATVEAAHKKAEDLLAKIKAGKSFAELAKKYSDDPGSAEQGGDLGYFARGVMDPAFEKAAFSLKVGEVSKPVRTSFGFHLIKLEAIRKSKAKKFEDVRKELIPAYLKDAAEKKYYGLAEKLTNLAYESPDSLSEVSDQLGLKLMQSPLFSRAGGSGIFAKPRVVDAAFSDDVLTQGYNSEPVEISEDHVVVLRLLQHKEASQLPLEKVQDQVKVSLIEEAAREKVQKVGADAVKQLQTGKADSSIAGKFAVAWKDQASIGRDSKTVDANIIKEVFRMKKPAKGAASYDGVVLPNGDYAIIALSKVTDGDPATVKKENRENIKRRLIKAASANARSYLMADLKSKAKIQVQQEDL
jgi:peptidyl-prolyl cis-trans isomerase D